MSSEFRKWQPFEGYQFKYVYLIDKKSKLTKPEIPFSKIDELGAGMYKGEKITLQERRGKESDKADSNANSKLDA